jgi:hypothetical protein
MFEGKEGVRGDGMTTIRKQQEEEARARKEADIYAALQGSPLQGPMTLVIDSATYDGNQHGAVVSVGGQVPGDKYLTLTYTSIGTTPALSDDTQAPKNAGSYTVCATYGDLPPATGTLTIAPAPLLIVAPNVTLQYGVTLADLNNPASAPGSAVAPTVSDSPDHITATAALFAPPSTQPVLVGGRVPALAYVGAITAVPSFPTNVPPSNYSTPIVTPGTLTVTQAPLVVVAPNVTVPSGETLDDLDSALASAPPPTVSDNPDGISATATLSSLVPIPTKQGPWVNAIIPVLSANATTVVLGNYSVVTPSSAPSGTSGTPGTLAVTQVELGDARATELFRRVSSDAVSAGDDAVALSRKIAGISTTIAHFKMPIWSGSAATVAGAAGTTETKLPARASMTPQAPTAATIALLAESISKGISTLESTDLRELAQALSHLEKAILNLTRPEAHKFRFHFPSDIKFPLPHGDVAEVRVSKLGESKHVSLYPHKDTGVLPPFRGEPGEEYEAVALFNEFVIQKIKIKA